MHFQDKLCTTGDHCETESPCDRVTCDNDGECVNKTKDFECSCPINFYDKTCSREVDHCLSSPCMYGSCVNLLNGYRCDDCPSDMYHGFISDNDTCGKYIFLQFKNFLLSIKNFLQFKPLRPTMTNSSHKK